MKWKKPEKLCGNCYWYDNKEMVCVGHCSRGVFVNKPRGNRDKPCHDFAYKGEIREEWVREFNKWKEKNDMLRVWLLHLFLNEVKEGKLKASKDLAAAIKVLEEHREDMPESA